MKILTIELDKKNESVELHLDKNGAEYLRDLLTRLIESDAEDHLHLMTDEWGGNELTSEKQNQFSDVDLINHLKIMYWK